MKTNTFFVIFIFALYAAASSAEASAACRGRSIEEISWVFDHAIDINNRFKTAVRNGDDKNYYALRHEIEHYSEGIAFPCVRRVAAILVKENDNMLMHDLMRFVVSFENSADETLSAAFGRIFADNPQAIERTIKKFPSAERAIIVQSVRAGWENTKKGIASNIVKDRETRINRLML